MKLPRKCQRLLVGDFRIKSPDAPFDKAFSTMQRARKIVHIDMDAFFASVEQLDNPALRGRPVIVGGSPESRGVVAACSYEARRFGIHSAMAAGRAARLCPQAIFIRPRMSRYRELSARIMDIFHDYTDIIEPLSVDEAFLDLTINHCDEPSASVLADRIRADILARTGLTASAGVSCNKFLAKVATDLHKPNGLTVIPPAQAIAFLSRLPIGKFYGVGAATEKKMERIGVKNGADLRRFSREDLVFHFGKSGHFFYDICRGEDDRPVRQSTVRKSIGSETTLAEDTLDTQYIREILIEQANSVATSLIRRNFGGYSLTLKVRYHDFTTITRSTTLKSPIFTCTDILNCLPRLIAATEIGRKKVRLLGLTVASLFQRDSRPIQLVLPFPTEGLVHW
ncbi:MAG: DNA polymerase IV [Desulfopila sp.]